jgi:arginine decarboxylase
MTNIGTTRSSVAYLIEVLVKIARECEYVPIAGRAIEKELATGRQLVSTTFVIPYPPGFPILVPGQVISQEIITFMRALDVKEIHGYRPELGLRVFTEHALAVLEVSPSSIQELPT